jgi:LPS sulfotransferase NodH
MFPGVPSDTFRFEQAFGRVQYIYLSRADKVAQAVSLIKAEQSGLWHMAPDGTEIERLSAPQELHYDFERIHGEVSALEAFDRGWEKWFEQQQVDPLRIDYESLSDDPAGVLINICKTLGVKEPDAQLINPGLARLSDHISLEWIGRYKADPTSATSPNG